MGGIQRRRVLGVAGFALLCGAIALWLGRANWSSDSRVGSRASDASSAQVAPRPPTVGGESAPPVQRPQLGSREWSDSGALPRPRFKTAGLFGDDCSFGVAGHCREWAAMADKCDSGDVAACVRLGDLLVSASPMQPLWGALLLERACELGRDEACERAHRWREWARYGYNPSADGIDDVPAGLVEACEVGDQVACGLREMRLIRGSRPIDRDGALASCRAGFRDVCAVLIEAARDGDDVVSALAAGCDLPDAWLCFHLSRYFRSDCAVEHSKCPTPDEARAEKFERLACELDPSIRPCSSP